MVMRLRLASPLLLLALASCQADPDNISGPKQSEPMPSIASTATSFVVDSLSADRQTVNVYAVGLAGSCSGTPQGSFDESPSGLRLTVTISVPTGDAICTANTPPLPATFSLPRPLRSDEQLQGACDPTGDGASARYCRELRDTLSRPS